MLVKCMQREEQEEYHLGIYRNGQIIYIVRIAFLVNILTKSRAVGEKETFKVR